MKILDKYILKFYLNRFLGVFAICFIIFIIQTFWLYIDELAGKGLDIITIGKFFLYFSPKLVPLVLPLSILLASLITYGTLSENYEFIAMKSNGISIVRSMIALFIFHVFFLVSMEGISCSCTFKVVRGRGVSQGEEQWTWNQAKLA